MNMDVYAKLKSIEDRWTGCQRCELSKQRKKQAFRRGAPEVNLVIVGEAPGQEEDEQGYPFVGPAGRALDELMKSIGMVPHNEVFITNLVCCRPPGNRVPEPDEIVACAPRLDAMLWALDAKAILALGGTAAGRLVGSKKVSNLLDDVHEYEMWWKGATKVIPVVVTWHPSYYLRNGKNERIGKQIKSAIRLAQDIARG